MLLDVESILRGTWSDEASDDPDNPNNQPLEFIHFSLMQGMEWSWEELKRTPEYVQKYCIDFLNLKSKIAKENEDKNSVSVR